MSLAGVPTPPADLDRALRALSDPSRSTRGINLSTLSDLDQKGLERFQATWITLPVERRQSLLVELLRTAELHVEVTFSRIFRWLLSDTDPWIRSRAVGGLWEDEDIGLIGPLLQLFKHDQDPGVRAAAASALGRYVLLGELDQIDHGISILVESSLLAAFTGGERNPDVQRQILESLAYSGEAGVQDLIRTAYDEEDSAMRVSAVVAMGRSADIRWRSVVLAELSSPDLAMRTEAALASGELEIVEAVRPLIAMLDDDTSLRDAAVRALGRIGGPEARRALRACRDSDDISLAEAADEALAELMFLFGDDSLPGFLFED